MHRKVNFTKGTTSQHFTYTVKVSCSNRGSGLGNKWTSDKVRNCSYFPRAGTQVSHIGVYLFEGFVFMRAEDFAIESFVVDITYDFFDHLLLFLG